MIFIMILMKLLYYIYYYQKIGDKLKIENKNIIISVIANAKYNNIKYSSKNLKRIDKKTLLLDTEQVINDNKLEKEKLNNDYLNEKNRKLRNEWYLILYCSEKLENSKVLQIPNNYKEKIDNIIEKINENENKNNIRILYQEFNSISNEVNKQNLECILQEIETKNYMDNYNDSVNSIVNKDNIEEYKRKHLETYNEIIKDIMKINFNKIKIKYNENQQIINNIKV